MKFLRLHDRLVRLLYEDDDIIAVDKPYGIDTHTNEAKKGNEDYVVPGLIELFEAQLGVKLHIIHRLDQTTTGVIVFGKSLESAKIYQQFFRNRETQKTYVFVTASKSSADRFSTDQTILHKGSELEASTDFSKLSSSGRFEKWEASPHTGRNHQIRIHGAHVGLSLLGDTKYGGEKFPFICLHNRRIEFPNGVAIESREPRYFQKLELLENQHLAVILLEIDRRERLFGARRTEGTTNQGELTETKRRNENSISTKAASESFRLVHPSGEQDGALLVIDQLGDVVSVAWSQDRWTPREAELFGTLAREFVKPILVRLTHATFKQPSGKPREEWFRPDTDDDARQKSGKYRSPTGTFETAPWIAKENGLKFEIRTDVGQSLGLFPDQRLHRNWVQQNANGKTVLNLFSYTGAYSVAAAKGGAREVTSVDTSKAALNWSRKNFELNDMTTEAHRFLNRDALQFLEQCAAKDQKFDLVICDAPSFSRGDKGLFKLDVEIENLLALLFKATAATGDILFATHHEALKVDDIRRKIVAAPGAKGCDLYSIQSALDFELPGERVMMKSFLIRRGRG